MNCKKRILYLDMAKGVGIVLMIAGHLIGALQSIDYKPYFPPSYQFISSFHMPLFFVISGILLRITREEERDMRQVICRKAKTLLVPYVSFSVIYFVMNIFTCIFFPDILTFPELGRFFIYSVTFRGVSVLWFLPALFLGEVIFLYWRRRMADGRLDLAVLAVGFVIFFFSPVFAWEGWEANPALMTAGALLQTAARGFLACTFLLAGYRSVSFLQKREQKSLPELLLGAALLACAGFLCFRNDSVDFNYMVFDHFILYVLCACCGSFGVILLCKNIGRCRLLLFYGTNSLVIMATHMEFKVMLHTIQISYWLNHFVTRAKEWVLYATMAACITILEAGIVYLFNHYFYFLIGRKKPEHGQKRKDKNDLPQKEERAV